MDTIENSRIVFSGHPRCQFIQYALLFPDVLDQPENWEYTAEPSAASDFIYRLENFCAVIRYTPVANRLIKAGLTRPIPALDEELHACKKGLDKITHGEDQLIIIAHGHGSIAATRFLQLFPESCLYVLFINPIDHTEEARRELVDKIATLPPTARFSSAKVHEISSHLTNWQEPVASALKRKIYEHTLSHWDEYSGEISPQIGQKTIRDGNHYAHLTNQKSAIIRILQEQYVRAHFKMVAARPPLHGGGKSGAFAFSGYTECIVSHGAIFWANSVKEWETSPIFTTAEQMGGVMRASPPDNMSGDDFAKTVMEAWEKIRWDYGGLEYKFINVAIGKYAMHAIRFAQKYPDCNVGLLLIDPVRASGADVTLNPRTRVTFIGKKSPENDQFISDLSRGLLSPPRILDAANAASFGELFMMTDFDYIRYKRRYFAEKGPPEPVRALAGGDESKTNNGNYRDISYILLLVCFIVILILLVLSSKGPNSGSFSAIVSSVNST
jgi:pimeloyl-ACP methyl ester carboxylesterase